MSYNEIEVLKGADGIRKNASMYIGPTNSIGYHHLFLEAFSNSVDEYLAGFTDKIEIVLNKNNSLSIIDYGRGIPNTYNEKEKENNLILACAYTHSGGKFDKKNYNSSAGLHGLGLTCLNFLSSYFKATSYRDGKAVSVIYEKGIKKDFFESNSKKRGTEITFIPDEEIFPSVKEFDPELLKSKIQELAYLCRGLSIYFKNEILNEEVLFFYPNGLVDYVELLASSKLLDSPIYINGEYEGIGVEMALSWLESGEEVVEKYYTNNVPNMDGGSHQAGFRGALTRTLNNYISSSDLPKTSQVSLSGDDVRDGIVAVVSIKHPSPSYSSQTKDKLVSETARTAVESVVNTKILDYLNLNPKFSKRLVMRAILAYKAREAARKAKEAVKKISNDSILLPGKLADCSSNNPEECELIICEGQSAGGSAKMGRDRRYQAILPLKGKILNVEKSSLKNIISNQEIAVLVASLGTGFGKTFDIKKLRYHKIIILSDADVDGSHIRCLILNLFFRQMLSLIDSGFVYIGQPPLYRMTYRGKSIYLKDDKQLEKHLTENNIDKTKIVLSRFKGLGEMSPEMLHETTLDPEKRILLQVKIDDYVEADRTFNILMGNQVEPRKNLIIDAAGFAKLDV